MDKRNKDNIENGLVSIITPVYNGEKNLRETIESVLGQSYPQWEMIIIDDGSTDQSPEIAGEYTRRDGRIHLIRQDNSGTAAARNAGIRAARGQYIALLDSDDLWVPAFLEKQIGLIKKSGGICVYASYSRVDEMGKEIMRPTLARSSITARDMRVMDHIGCLTGLYDTRKYGKIYLHEELGSFNDDYAYWYDIVSLENKAYGNRDILAKYRVSKEGLTGKKWKLIYKQYQFYRGYLKESIPEAAINLIRWGLAGIWKFYL